MYDIFYVSKSDDKSGWENLKINYPSAQILLNVKTFAEIKNKSFTKMFWVVWDDLEINSSFNLNSYKATKWDDSYVHVFKNGDYYDGICLFPKSLDISQREFNNRFFINKKEIDISASNPTAFRKFFINNYDDYKQSIESCSTDMFWGIWNGITIAEDFKFDYRVPKYDAFHRNITHVFKNGKYYDGICLFSKNTPVSRREIENKFFTNKKEVDIIASHPNEFDIVFISYNETFADKNYENLKNKVKRPVHRVNGVKGIHQAHIEAAKLVSTEMFWVVDADAELVEDFKFDYQVVRHNYDSVFVWRSRNPINDLEYGYGGVKLFPTKLTLEMDTTTADMTTSISKKFMAVEELSNYTAFNTDPFNTWKSAFRECCKLSSRTIKGQIDDETQNRLDIWCTQGEDKPFGKYAISGAKAGRKYGEENRDNAENLTKINDFSWLKEQWNNIYE